MKDTGMWTYSVRDPAVIAEWQRRLEQFRSKSAWLRIPFYGGLLLSAAALWILPASAYPYVVAAEGALLLVVGGFASRYYYGFLKCPHCGNPACGTVARANYHTD